MTPEQRLTQIEIILDNAIKLSHSNTAKIDRNSESINRLTEKVDRNSESIDRLTERMDRLTGQIDRAMEIFIDSMGVMRTMQAEIKGLQQENRRIIERFFGEEETDE